MLRDTAEQTIISISGKVAAGGSATAVGSGVAGKAAMVVVENPDAAAQVIAWSDVGVICGIVAAGGGLLSQVYFNWRRDRRETKLHQAKMARLGSEK
jgi:uncharacterized membrane protein YebE (DUF533 family)